MQLSKAAKPVLSFLISNWERSINSMLQNVWNGKVYQSDGSEERRDCCMLACGGTCFSIQYLDGYWILAHDAQDVKQAHPHQPPTQLQDQSKRLPPLTAAQWHRAHQCHLELWVNGIHCSPSDGPWHFKTQNESSSARADRQGTCCQSTAQPMKGRSPR